MSSSVRVGVIGTGSMGRHHVRILSSMPGAELVGICDSNVEVARQIGADHGVATFDSMGELAESADAIVLAVPTVEHAELGCELLRRGKHLLVEKPIAISLDEADALIDAAGDSVLSVGHVEFYNPAVQALLGLRLPPGFLEIHRMAKFKLRSLDIDVVRDSDDPRPAGSARSRPERRWWRFGPRESTCSPIGWTSPMCAWCSSRAASPTSPRLASRPSRSASCECLLHQQLLLARLRQADAQRTVRGDGDAARPRIYEDLPAMSRGRPTGEGVEPRFWRPAAAKSRPLVDGRQGRRALKTAIAVAEVIDGRGHRAAIGGWRRAMGEIEIGVIGGSGLYEMERLEGPRGAEDRDAVRRSRPTPTSSARSTAARSPSCRVTRAGTACCPRSSTTAPTSTA